MGAPIKAIGGVFKSIFNPDMPKIEKPQAVIGPTDPEVAAAAARKRLQARAKSGREGTIFSPSYSNVNLAGTA